MAEANDEMPYCPLMWPDCLHDEQISYEDAVQRVLSQNADDISTSLPEIFTRSNDEVTTFTMVSITGDTHLALRHEVEVGSGEIVADDLTQHIIDPPQDIEVDHYAFSIDAPVPV